MSSPTSPLRRIDYVAEQLGLKGPSGVYDFIRRGLLDPPLKAGKMSVWLDPAIEESKRRILNQGKTFKPVGAAAKRRLLDQEAK